MIIIPSGRFEKLKVVLKMLSGPGVGDAFVWSLLQNLQSLLFVCFGFEGAYLSTIKKQFFKKEEGESRNHATTFYYIGKIEFQ